MPGPLAALPPLGPRPFVSVVIPALNEERYIGPLLDALTSQTYAKDCFEVIVADGGSSDRTRSIVAEAAEAALPSVRLVENPGRTTAHGLNAGAKVARGDVILILGAHSLVPPGFIEANIDALRTSGATAVGGPIRTVGEGVVAASIAAAMSHPFGVGDARFRYSDRAGDVDTIAFAAYRRECFDVLGGFDTNRNLAEDDDFNFRVRKAGGRLYLAPSIQSTYYARGTLPGLVRQYHGYGHAKGLAFRADPRALGPRHFVPAAVVTGGALLLVLSLVSRRARLALSVLGATYGQFSYFSAKRAARRSPGAKLPLTALAFPLIHLSYGVGMLRALLAR